ncbi:MAG: hypothetical protein AAGF12_35595, partial [Myxococcota bacterium]
MAERRNLGKRGAFALGASLLGVLALPPPAGAHLGSTKYLRLTPTEAGARLQVAIEAVDASM